MKTHKTLETIEKRSAIREVASSPIHDGELLTEPLFVGVCGTDLQIIRRQRPDPANILGHEGIARVIKGSRAAEGINEGDYVVFNPVDPTDQNQILGHNTPGLLQEEYVVTQHAIENDLVVPFPGNINPTLGALVEPLGTVIYGHELGSKVVKQSSIVIVGAGAIGIMHALYAKAQGYEKIILVNASQSHLDWCVKRGIVNREDTLLGSDELSRQILAITDGQGVDAVYMCTSRPSALVALQRAVEYVKPEGCINLVGGIKDGDQLTALPGIKDLNAIRRANFCGLPSQGIVEKTTGQDGKSLYLTGHRGTSRRHFEVAIRNLQDHGQIFIKVVSHIVSLEAAASLFSRIAEGPMHEFNEATYIKAVVDVRLAGKVIKNV